MMPLEKDNISQNNNTITATLSKPSHAWATYYKPILRLGVPIAIGQLGVIIMGFADTMMVGHFSTDALAAASFVNSVFNLITYMLLGYSYGLTPLISSLVGRGKKAEAGATLKYGVACNLLFAIALMIGLTIVYLNLEHMGQPAEILPLVRPYFLTIMVSAFFVALFNSLRQFTDGISETSTGMWVILTGNALNIIGNYFLIYGVGPFPRLGLLGAGISTLSARIVMALIMVVLLLTRKRYAAYREGFKRAVLSNWRKLVEVNKQSFPISLQMGMESGAFTASGIMAGWLGALDLATYQVMITLSGLGFLLYYSFGSGITIRVAHFCGQNDWAGVRQSGRAGMHILLAMAAIVSIVFYFLGGFIVKGFTSDPAVIALALTLIFPMVLYQFGDSMQICFANALRGTSHVMSMMWIALISYVIVNIPACYLLAFPLGFGIQGLYYSFSIGLFTAAGLFSYQYYRVLRQSEKATFTKQ